MPRITFALILVSLIAAAQARAADEPAKKTKSSNKVERAVEKASAAMGRTADKVEKKVKKGVDKTTKAIETAGNKTSRWLHEKLD